MLSQALPARRHLSGVATLVAKSQPMFRGDSLETLCRLLGLISLDGASPIGYLGSAKLGDRLDHVVQS
jgi:hypothetical protein